MTTRCDWATHNELEQTYHDTEWGKSHKDDSYLFQLLVLESMQAGLSWITILKKRDTLATAYDNWDYKKIAAYDDTKWRSLLEDPGVIRHQLKIKATTSNAQSFIKIQEEFSSFSDYIWGFVNHMPINNQWETIKDVPSSTQLSDTISKDLKRRGFKFLGSTTVYAYLQAIGIVNDHLVSCDYK